MIAHALISRPRLLLLDEPLANLDLRSGQEVVGCWHRLAAEQQIAVLISAHDMNPLLPVMDRIVYVAAGRAAVGPATRWCGPRCSASSTASTSTCCTSTAVVIVAGEPDGSPPPGRRHRPPGPGAGIGVA